MIKNQSRNAANDSRTVTMHSGTQKGNPGILTLYPQPVTINPDPSFDNISQIRKKKEHEQLVKANTSEFNKYWLLIDDILATGRAIYKKKDKNKAKDYTYTELIKVVRMKHKARDNGGEETNGGTEAK
ncbi:MAG TPA: hypothetical protein VIH57_08885 [Bacteroidales bacterium]|jgi:hypothetical protein